MASPFWQKELDEFTRNLSLLREDNNEEAVHDLRVAVKKLRSYLTLYIHLSGKKNLEKTFQSTEELFAVLGVQRNIEMSKKLAVKFLLRNASLVTTVNNYFDGLNAIAQQNSSQALEQYNQQRLFSIQLPVVNNFEKETAACIRKQFKSIKRDLKDFDENYHRVRKKIKDIYYRAKILPADAVFTKQQLKHIDKTLEHLGDAQDCEMLEEHMKRFRQNLFDKEVKAFHDIRSTEEKIRDKRDDLKKEAHKMLGKIQ